MSESPPQEQRIVQREIEDEMRSSYLDYAMSVLVSRALPDVRDGLKPVQRRILYTMFRLGLLHNKPFRKSATIIGNTMARFHPHGDSSIYDALVRMAQNFSLRYPMVDGQGNWGSIDGDNAAAFRYTEARLTSLAEELLFDIDKDTVDFVPNFDGASKEPVVLPCRFPNLLVNGSSGIAVGMATNMPPHNMAEVIDAVIMQIGNPDVSVDGLMSVLPGPDFPTGASIRGVAGIRSAYLTGKGLLRVRAKSVLESKAGRERIVVSEIPYQVNKSLLLEEVAELVKSRVIQDISDIRDESDRNGMRIVFELKKGCNPDVVLNQLFSHSRLESTIAAALVCLVDGRPRTVHLKQLLGGFIQHRKSVVVRRCSFELKRASERLHIVDGLVVALRSIDAVVQAIRASRDIASAKSSLMANFSLSEPQAIAVLEMRLQKLASLEQDSLLNEQKELALRISELGEILASPDRILGIIKSELLDVRQRYGDARRTEIVALEDEDFADEDLIKPEEVVVTVTHSGYAKRTLLSEYRQQHRGGKGVIAASTRDGDFVERLFVANTHSYLLLFTNHGIVHWLKVHELPDAGRGAVGKAIVNLLSLDEGEVVTAVIPVMDFGSGYLVMATRKGTIKKTELSAYSNPRKGGIIAITLDETDELIGVVLTGGNQQLLLATVNGSAVRFVESDIRSTGRSARGVRGIRLKNDDAVIGMVVADESKSLVTVCANGYGKRTPVGDYRLVGRGGSGVINIQATDRNGRAVAIASVSDEDELMFISRNGITIRIPAKDVSIIGRNTQGARVMRLDEGDFIVSVALIAKEAGSSGVEVG